MIQRVENIGPVAVVSGANKGLGFEISKLLAKAGMTVVMTSRDVEKGKKACQKLQDDKLRALFYPMDVTVATSIKRAADYVERELGRCDVLINNAGIFIDKNAGALDVSGDTIMKTFETNTLGHLMASQAFIPVMKKHHYGRIVNMSSGLGSLHEMEGGFTAYRISKAALNAVTRIIAAEVKGESILVNSMCPGWCRTDMGGPEADRSPEQGADTALFLATLPEHGPTGKYFRDRKEIPW
jgi:NAD(P)-dependent dehydrogenase (short-subunit alcohol dehydrogenase family)